MIAKTEDRGRIRIIWCAGKLTIGHGDTELRTLINDALDLGIGAVVVDFGEVFTIDSSGIGELVGCYTSAIQRRVMFALSHPYFKLRELLIETELRTVIPVFQTADEAVAAFSDITFDDYMQRIEKWTTRGTLSGA